MSQQNIKNTIIDRDISDLRIRSSELFKDEYYSHRLNKDWSEDNNIKWFTRSRLSTNNRLKSSPKELMDIKQRYYSHSRNDPRIQIDPTFNSSRWK